MSAALNNLYSRFHFRSLREVDHLKEISAQIVKDIQNHVDEDLEIDVFLEPVCKSKKSFEVKLKVVGLGDVIVASKVGKNPVSLLKKNRRTVLRSIRRRLRKRNLIDSYQARATA